MTKKFTAEEQNKMLQDRHQKKVMGDLAARTEISQKKKSFNASMDAGQFAKTSLTLDTVIGLPPSVMRMSEESGGELTEKLVMASMPIMAIYPAESNVGAAGGKKGLHLLHLVHTTDKYNKILGNAGITPLSGSCLYVAFLNESSISEGFSNDFGDSQLEEMTNAIGDKMREMSAITGTSNMGEMASQIKNAMAGGGIISQIMGATLGGLGNMASWGQNKLNQLSPGLGNIAGGARHDMPVIWKGSSFAPSYSCTVRLYNPYPEDDSANYKYIVEPLARLVALAMPISDVGFNTYNAPLMCSVVCPGLFMIKAGFVSGLDVIKGGDSNSISFIQRSGIVDVRLTLTGAYNSIVANVGAAGTQDPFRPTFVDYVNHLQTKSEVPNIFTGWTGLRDDDLAEDTMSVSPGTQEKPADAKPVNRTPASAKKIADNLGT